MIWHNVHQIFKKPFSPWECQIGQIHPICYSFRDFHNRIEQEKTERLRKDCLEQTDKMIRKLSTLFDTFDTEDEYRNNTLHELRALNKKISSRPGHG